MKAKSANIVLFHYLDGQHREVAAWHNEVHRPSTHGMVPNIYYSQDWVAPADFVKARPHNDLANLGGEYATLFLSQGTREQLEQDSRTASEIREQAHRPHPHQEVVWRARCDFVAAHARDDLEFAVDAVPLAPNTGMMLVAEEIGQQGAADYTEWRERVQVPKLMGSKLFSACFEFSQTEKDGRRTDVQFWFIDRTDPLSAFSTAQALDGENKASRDTRRLIFASVYRSIPPGKYDFYE